MDKAIEIDQLSKTFIANETFPGIWGTFKGLFCARKHEVLAIRNLSFQVKSGERVAFIGPNGAGKSTTIKMW